MGTATEVGPLAGMTFTLQSSPGRMDLALTPAVAEASGEATWPLHIGSLEPSLCSLAELALQLRRRFECVTRVALGAVLLHPVEDNREGAAWLQRYVPDVRLAPDGYDFLYRINRQTTVGMGASSPLLVHRVMTFGIVSIVSSVLIEGRTALRHACRLEIDLSTDARRDESLPADTCSRVYEELRNMAADIADQGDSAAIRASP
jgi:hypothetical protein